MQSLFVFNKEMQSGKGFSFTPAPNVNEVKFTRAVPMKMGYAPDGMSEAQYKAMIAKENAKKAAKSEGWRKSKGSAETLTEWQAERDKKFPNSFGDGHRYVKFKGNALEKPGTAPKKAAGGGFFGKKR